MPDALSKYYIPVALLTLLICRLIFYQIYPLFDDAFITIRHNVHLLEHKPFSYNINEPVLETIVPLFGLVLTPIVALGTIFSLPPEKLVPFVNIGLELALAALILRVAGKQIWGYIFVLLYAFFPLAARISLGGMEYPLFLPALMSGFVLCEQKKYGYSLAIAAVACFIRPEASLAVLIIGILTLREVGLRQSLVLSLIPATILASGALLLWSVYGHVLPHSMSAITGNKGESFFKIIILVFDYHPIANIFAVLMFFNLPVDLLKKHKSVLNFYSFCIAYAALYMINNQHIQLWHTAPLVLLLCLIIGMVLQNLLEKPNDFIRKIKPQVLMLAPLFSIAITVYTSLS